MFVASPVLDVILKVTVVLAVAAIAARARSRGSAAARHQIWAVALAASLLMPVLAAIAPQWTIAVLPAPLSAVETVAAPVELQTANADPVFEPIPAMTPSVSAEPQPRTASVNPLSTTTTIWLAGVLLVLARLGFGTARVWLIARRATPAPAWTALGHHLARSLGIDRGVTFLSGDEDAMPMAWGLIHAHVLLPAEADDWPIERQRVVLLHELAHVKRRDSLTQMLAHLACATYWFNPLVWLAAERLRAERERACDDLVLAAGTRGSDYADHLLDIARSLRSGAWPTWSAVTMAHRSQLEGRLMAILDPALPRRSPTRRAVAAFTAIAVVSIVSLAGVRAVAKAAEAEEQGRPSAPAAPAPTPAPTPTPAPVPAPAPLAPRVAVLPTPIAPSVTAPVPAAPMPAPFVVAPVPPIPPAPPVAVAPFLDLDIERTVVNAVNVAFAEPPQPPQPPQPAQPVQQGKGSNADPKITAALTTALKDENEDVRKQALQTLVRMRAPLPPDVVSGMLKDKSPDVRRQAVFALGQQRDPKNASLLNEALKDENADVRQQAAFALGQLRDSRAIDPLITASKDSDADVRRQAVFSLGQLRDARAVDALIAALKDPNADVRQQAVHALGQIR
jgi:beta-lactamase regulating signal transducer with metallopeptidase domain